MSELNITEEEVREEHMQQVQPWAHWLYLFSVLAGGLILMVLLMAALGAGR